MASAATDLSPLDRQMAEIVARYPGATIQPGSGALIVTIPAVRLPDGWSKASSAVHFVVPPGYPYANPDCFHVDADLRLVGGSLPQASNVQPLDPIGNTLWFSWHLQRPWQPGRDTLITWMAVVQARFEERR